MGTAIPSAMATFISFPTRSHRKSPQIFPKSKNRLSVLSVLAPSTSVTTKDANSHNSFKISTHDNTIATTSNKTVYHDNWLENMAISYLSKAFQETAGIKNDTPGYKGIAEVSAEVYKKYSPTEQREIVLKVLDKVVPSFTLFVIKLMPQTKFTRELFAAFTTVSFGWLVGPSEVKESEVDGKIEKNVVHITKCRFLEEANCIGICTNQCKMATQEFIKKKFGTPVNMVPNFDDMSCEMIFGQEPPAQEDDPAFKKPCYKLCNIRQRHSTNCIS
uniref:D27 n=1 Tax=Chrysanthemum morifolium TaxID=41568 RepID=A0A0M4MEG4_CHRMO|nr:D27 [Chrysanthemum x morifolium]